jgi:CBS domain-containing protein
MTAESVETMLKSKKIYQIVNPKLVQSPSKTPVRDVMALIQSNRGGYCVIADNKKVVGIFTENDVVKRLLGKGADLTRPVAEFMTREVKVLTPQNSVGDAINLMGSHRFYHIPLVNESADLVGVLSVRTLIRFLAAYYPTEIYNLPPKSDQIMRTPEGG